MVNTEEPYPRPFPSVSLHPAIPTAPGAPVQTTEDTLYQSSQCVFVKRWVRTTLEELSGNGKFNVVRNDIKPAGYLY